MTPAEREAERMLEAWGQYYRLGGFEPINLGYPGATPEARAGLGSRSTKAWQPIFSRSAESKPEDVLNVEAVVTGSHQWWAIYQRYRNTGKTDADFAGVLGRELRNARAAVVGWVEGEREKRAIDMSTPAS